MGPDADIEEGECLSDDDEEPDLKVTDKSPEADKEEDEEDDIGGMISFQGNIFDEEILTESTNEVVVPTDVIKLIKDNFQDIDIKDKVDNSIVINNCLVNLAMKIDFSDEISYDFESLVFFVKNMTQPHPVYIKKVSNIDQVIALVHMDHRKVLIDAFTSEKVERFKDLPVLSNEAKMRRLYKQFQKLSSRIKTIPGSLPQTKYNEFQPLFDKYFMAIYLSGFVCQKNWLEVSRVAAEELVNCWLSADFQYTHLLKNMATLRARHTLTEKK